MALISRISRLFKADFHAVLDRIEEPEQLLKQAIREMEDELALTEQRIKVGTHDLDILSRRQSDLEGSLQEIDEEIELCFASGKDDLARNLVRKKLEAQRLLKRLRSGYESSSSTLSEQRGLLEENRAALDELRQKAELFERRSPVGIDAHSQLDDIDWMVRELRPSDDEVEIAFLREQERRSTS